MSILRPARGRSQSDSPITRLPLNRAVLSNRAAADDGAAGESPVEGFHVDPGSYSATVLGNALFDLITEHKDYLIDDFSIVHPTTTGYARALTNRRVIESHDLIIKH